MDGPTNQIPVEAYVQQMRQRMELTLRRVAQAVNDAPDGAWINDSEWQVFHAFNDLRRDAYEQALQMRADAASSAFSPDQPRDGPGQNQQGAPAAQHAERKRAGEHHAPALSRSAERRRRRRR